MTQTPTIRFLDSKTPPHILTLVVLAGVGSIAQSMFLPSLAGMAQYFDVEYSLMQLALSGYMLMTAVVQLIAGPISDRLGRRPVAIAGLIIFVLATIGVLFSTHFEVFMACRMLQAGAAVGVMLGRSAVRDVYEPAQAAAMLGYVSMGISVLPMFGPAIGGALDQAFGWRASFALNLIFALVTIFIVWRDMGETNARVLDRTKGAPRAPTPSVRPLLTAPRFWGYCAAFTLASAAFFALLGAASFVGEVVFGLTPFISGLCLAAPAFGYMLGNLVSARKAPKFGINRMALWGAYIGAGATLVLLVCGLAGIQNVVLFFGMCFFLGIGNGLTVPNATVGSLSVRAELAGTAAGLGGALMIGGGAIFSAIAGLTLDPATGALPLEIIMFVATSGSVIAMLLVIKRARRLGRDL